MDKKLEPFNIDERMIDVLNIEYIDYLLLMKKIYSD